MFDCSFSLNEALQLLIALLALFIAWIEFRKMREEDKIKKANEVSLELILASLDDTDNLLLEIQQMYGKMSKTYYMFNKMGVPTKEPRSWTSEECYLAGAVLHYPKKCYEEILEKYPDGYVPQLKSLYEHLVKSESMFSMSYGYGRFIDQLRPIISQGLQIKEMKESIDKLSTESFDNYDIINVINKNKLFLDELVTNYKKLSPYITELVIRSKNEKVKKIKK